MVDHIVHNVSLEVEFILLFTADVFVTTIIAPDKESIFRISP